MFSQMIKYRFLCQLRSKESIFWLLFFPMILSVMFYAGLRDIANGEKFEAVDIAVVDDAEFEKEKVMASIIENVSADHKESVDSDKIFVTQYVSKEEAEKLLDDNKVSAYIYFNDECNVVFKKNGTKQTIVKKFFDIAIQKEKLFTEVARENNGNIPPNLLETINDSTSYIKDVSNKRGKADTVLQNFYSILGMVCMYGAATGCVAMNYLQTNQSALAKRNTVAPVSKMKQLLSYFLVDMLMNDVIVLLVLAFIRFALGIDFGNRTGLIIFTTIVGGTMGLSFGYFFASITKKSVEFKNNMVIGISMICSFLAGMMSNEVQYFVKQHAYIIDRINPVNLITESYYKLYYYTDLSKYYENIIILIMMTVLFAIGTITVLTVQDKKMMRESRG
ncbi:MAG: ABC transporter permease [Clostridiales bacterium]|nr:ABC transporter permease [Clostridiales bacterium]